VALDTHLWAPVRHRDRQLDEAYDAAARMLEVATAQEDPLYMALGHSMMAYWMLTSSQFPPYTLGAVKKHVADAKRCTSKARVYAEKQELHRGATIVRDVEGVLASVNSGRAPPDDEPIWEALLLSDHEAAEAGRGATSRRRDDPYGDRYMCSACMRVVNRTMRCSRCKRVAYCSKECQKAHWKTHKPFCKPAKPASK